MNYDQKRDCPDCNYNKGIHCDVKNCVYHDGECYCTAEKISVGPTYASTSTDTACVTFEQKEA